MRNTGDKCWNLCFGVKQSWAVAGVWLLCALAIGCQNAGRRSDLGKLYRSLDRACIAGDEIGVEKLIKAGADPSGPRGYAVFHATDKIGLEPAWPLYQAAYYGHPGVVRLLLQAGADPNLACGEGFTALTVAADKGHAEIVTILLAGGADRDYAGMDGTAAQIALRRGYTNILDLLR